MQIIDQSFFRVDLRGWYCEGGTAICEGGYWYLRIGKNLTATAPTVQAAQSRSTYILESLHGEPAPEGQY